VNLGYKSATAKKIIDRVVADSPGALNLDELLKKALKGLSV